MKLAAHKVMEMYYLIVKQKYTVVLEGQFSDWRDILTVIYPWISFEGKDYGIGTLHYN